MLVAVEGGGTKTRGWLLKGDEVVARGLEGPSNVQALGAARAAELVVRLVDALVKQAGAARESVTALGLGMAGAGTAEDRDRLRSALAAAGARVPAAIVSDARAALEGATRGAGGVVLIAGTGSIALAVGPGDVEARAGGWGSALGDEGSAFALGRALLVQVTKELDGRTGSQGSGGGLEMALTAHLGRDAYDLASWIRQHARNATAVAALAPLVLELAEKGQKHATEMCDSEAGELGLLAAAAAQRAGLPTNTRVVLYGGCLLGSAHYREAVTAALQVYLPGVQVIVGDVDDGLRGCASLARRELARRAEGAR